jgi:hypothetical protein
MPDINANVIKLEGGATETAVDLVARMDIGMLAVCHFEDCLVYKKSSTVYITYPNNDKTLSLITANSIEDAPIDGDTYVRKDGGWVSIDLTPYPFEDTKDPTGINTSEFTSRELLDMSSTTTTLFSVKPNASNVTEYSYLYKGTKVVVSEEKTIALTPASNRIYYIYFDDETATLQAVTSISGWEEVIRDNVFIAELVYNDAGTGFVSTGFEAHGCQPWQTHYYLHSTVGTAWSSGGSVVPTEDTQDMIVTSALIEDEDIIWNTKSIAIGDNIRTLFRENAGWDFGDYRAGVYNIGGVPYYNLNTGGNWSQEPVPNNDYVLLHIYGRPDFNEDVFAVMGQVLYTGKNDAREGASGELLTLAVDGLIFPEFKPFATAIVKNQGGTWDFETVDGDGSMVIDWRSSRVGTPIAGTAPTPTPSFQQVTDVDSTTTNGITVDGSSDEVQLRVQGHSTQTANILEVENSAGTDLLTVSTSGLSVVGAISSCCSITSASATIDSITTDAINAGTPTTTTAVLNVGASSSNPHYTIATTSANTLYEGDYYEDTGVSVLGANVWRLGATNQIIRRVANFNGGAWTSWAVVTEASPTDFSTIRLVGDGYFQNVDTQQDIDGAPYNGNGGTGSEGGTSATATLTTSTSSSANFEGVANFEAGATTGQTASANRAVGDTGLLSIGGARVQSITEVSTASLTGTWENVFDSTIKLKYLNVGVAHAQVVARVRYGTFSGGSSVLYTIPDSTLYPVVSLILSGWAFDGSLPWKPIVVQIGSTGVVAIQQVSGYTYGANTEYYINIEWPVAVV